MNDSTFAVRAVCRPSRLHDSNDGECHRPCPDHESRIAAHMARIEKEQPAGLAFPQRNKGNGRWAAGKLRAVVALFLADGPKRFREIRLGVDACSPTLSKLLTACCWFERIEAGVWRLSDEGRRNVRRCRTEVTQEDTL